MISLDTDQPDGCRIWCGLCPTAGRIGLLTSIDHLLDVDAKVGGRKEDRQMTDVIPIYLLLLTAWRRQDQGFETGRRRLYFKTIATGMLMRIDVF